MAQLGSCSQPGRHVEEAEGPVDHAVIAIEQPEPHHRAGGHRQDAGQVEDNAEDADMFQVLVEQQRRGQGNNEAERYGEDCIDEREIERMPEVGIGKKQRVVLGEADVAGRRSRRRPG